MLLPALLPEPAQAAGNVSINRTFQPSSADSRLVSNQPDTNYGSSAYMDTSTTPRHSVVRFDISSIPTDSGISSATLSLYVTSVLNNKDYLYRTVGARRILVDWVESTVTWNTPGSTEGTHYASTATATKDIYGTSANENQFYDWDVTTDVSDFVAGTQTNYGWRMVDEGGDATSTVITYVTKEDANAANHPKLTVTYTAPWDSYESDYSTIDDLYDTAGDIICMKGTGFAAGSYVVRYYDDDGTQVGTDANITVPMVGEPAGVLKSNLACNTNEGATAGIWNAKAYLSDGTTLIANDTFTVTPEAIPEFPTVIAALVVAGLCFSIYYWMRKRLGYAKA